MDGKVIIEAEIDTKQFDVQIDYLKGELEGIERMLSDPKKYGLNSEEVVKYNVEAEKLKNRLVDLYKKREELNNQPSRLEEWSEGFGRSLEQNIKKIGRLALGIFGIRSAYMAVRNAMNVIASDDAQLKADIDYMKNVLAYALEPVVRRIVDLMKILISYFGYLMNAWFHIDVFSKANAKALSSGAKSAKEMRKQLAGFDEMNVLQDNASSGAGGGAPGFDPSSFQNAEIPGWLKWIGEHGKDLIPIIMGISGALVAMRVLGLEPLQAMGIGIAIWGIVNAAREISDYIKDPQWEYFANALSYIGIAVIGIGVAFTSLPAVIVGAVVAITGILVGFWGEVRESIDNFITGLENSIKGIEELGNHFLIGAWSSIVRFLRDLYNSIETQVQGIKLIFDGFIGFFQGVFTGDWSKAWNNLGKITQGAVKVISGAFGQLTSISAGAIRIATSSIIGIFKDLINQFFYTWEINFNAFIQTINGAIGFLNKIPEVNIKKLSLVKLPRLAQGGIVNNPGPGVMMGNYIAGERGPEAVLPLTDDTLQRLASMIPITVNLTNTMNGRVISRELKKVQNENDFAFNR